MDKENNGELSLKEHSNKVVFIIESYWIHLEDDKENNGELSLKQHSNKAWQPIVVVNLSCLYN